MKPGEYYVDEITGQVLQYVKPEPEWLVLWYDADAYGSNCIKAVSIHTTKLEAMQALLASGLRADGFIHKG